MSCGMDSERVTSQINATIRRQLRVQGMRHSHLAAALGMSRVSLSRRLNGHVAWTVDELTAVCELLDVELAELLTDAVLSH